MTDGHVAPFIVAGVQMDIQFADPVENLRRMEDRLLETTKAGAELTVFPECTTTGYCFDTLAEAKEVAQSVDDDIVRQVHQICRKLNTMVVFGFLEVEEDNVFNSLMLMGPAGCLGRYRKIHLPHLGVDRFTTPGDGPFEVVQTPRIRIGMNICYDCAFPEAARSLALQGADLVVLPTNWPPTSSVTADHIPNARALENHVYFMAINRIGSERGVAFIGKSKICDPHGRDIAVADHAKDAILICEIDPGLARQKHLVNIPGKHEVDRFKDRRPDCYESLTIRSAD